MAYGQTGSGKSYTMLGDEKLGNDGETTMSNGLCQLMLDEVFTCAEKKLEHVKHSYTFIIIIRTIYIYAVRFNLIFQFIVYFFI